MPELLSPAGNFEKMRAAILYGADAVYLSGKTFGMRAAADNFTLDELEEAVEYAHDRGVKVYLTVNTMPREDQYPALEEYFAALSKIPVDALIIADIGVFMLARKLLPNKELHNSICTAERTHRGLHLCPPYDWIIDTCHYRRYTLSRGQSTQSQALRAIFCEFPLFPQALTHAREQLS